MPNPLLTKIVAKHKRPAGPEFRPGDTSRLKKVIKNACRLLKEP